MERIHKIVYTLAVFVLLAFVDLPGAAAVSTGVQSPEQVVQNVTTEMLNALRSRHKAYKNNPRQMVSLIERIIVPHFDVRIMAREALGLNWRRATTDQQKRFMTAFRQLLVNDYANEFRNYSDQTVKFLPEHDKAGKDYATVATHVATPAEQPVRVDYRLHRAGSDWRIYDVEIDGISLLFTYRDTFSQELQSETLDALITRMENKNAAFLLSTVK